MSTPTNQVFRQVKGTPPDESGSRTLRILLRNADWRNPTPAEKRDVDALCSGVVSSEEACKEAVSKAELLRSLKSFAEDSFAEDPDLESDSEAVDRFVIGIKRLLDSGKLERAHVRREIGQAAGLSALLPSDRDGMGHLVMTGSEADRDGKPLLELLLKACLNYRGDGSQSDASTLGGEVEAPEELGMLRDRGDRVSTIECNCQGDCHHMNRTRRVLRGAPTTTDATDVYQGERAGGRFNAIMRTVMNCVKSILRKILCLHSGRHQREDKQSTAK